MDMNLTLYETRVIGSLIEKELTTPDQYPLSLNALTSACNQKSNRDPVLELDEATVQETVDQLMKKHLILEKSGFGSRVPKYQHRFCNTGFSSLQFSPQQLGIICVLMLRGAQTPGELRGRTNRLCKFNDVHEVESTLKELAEWDDGPLVARLPREAGKRESRYVHLLSGEVTIRDMSEAVVRTADATGSERERLELLEQRVGDLQRHIEEMQRRLDQIAPAASSQEGGAELPERTGEL